MEMEEKLALLAARADAVQRGVDTLLARSAERRTWAHDFAVGASALLGELAGRSREAEAAGVGLAQRLEALSRPLAREAAPRSPAPTSGSVVEDTAAAARRLHEDVEAALAGLLEQTHVRHDRLAAETEVVAAGAQALSARVQAAGAALNDCTSRLSAALEALREEAAAGLKTAARAPSASPTADRPRGGLSRGPASRAPGSEWPARLPALQRRVESAAEQVADALADLGTRLRETGQESREWQAELEPLLEQLKKKMVPLQKTTAAAKETARTLGIY